MVDFALTDGRSTVVGPIIAASPVLYGIRGNTIPATNKADVEFIDWPFEDDNPSWRLMQQRVEVYQPKIAVAPDPGPDWSKVRVLAAADWLSDHVEHAVVVVDGKVLEVDDVPDRHRLGFQNRTRSRRRNPIGVGRFADRGDVHVLGGGLESQATLIREQPGIESTDGSNVVFLAKNKVVWTVNGRRQMDRDKTFGACLLQSLRNIAAAWDMDGADPDAPRLTRRVPSTESMDEGGQQTLESFAQMGTSPPGVEEVRAMTEALIPDAEVAAFEDVPSNMEGFFENVTGSTAVVTIAARDIPEPDDDMALIEVLGDVFDVWANNVRGELVIAVGRAVGY